MSDASTPETVRLANENPFSDPFPDVVEVEKYATQYTLLVDQGRQNPPPSPDGRELDVRTFRPAAPLPPKSNANVYFDISVGNEVTNPPVAMKACISPGRGVVVREDCLLELVSCIRPTSVVDRTVTGELFFPGSSTQASPVPRGEKRMPIVGSVVVELALLEAREPAQFVRVRVKALLVSIIENLCGARGVSGSGRDDSDVVVWIGCSDDPDNVFRQCPTKHETWEIHCEDGSIVQF